MVVLSGSLALGCSPHGRLQMQTPEPVIPDPPDLIASPPPPKFSDFPKEPLLDGPMVPRQAGLLFGALETGAESGGPCLLEPPVGALMPANWMRLRVRLRPPQPQNIFEIRIHS